MFDKRRYINRLAGVLTLLASCALQAQVPKQTDAIDEDIMDHWYVGAGIGLSLLEPETGSDALSLKQDSDFAYRLFGGYRFDDNWSAEVFWADLGQAEVEATSSGSLAGIVEYQSFGVGGVYQYPVSDSWDVFATAGVGRLRNSFQLVDVEQVEDNFIYAGGGVIWNFATTWDMRAEYDYYDKDAQAITLNVVKRFGSATPRRIRHLEQQVAEQQQALEQSQRVGTAMVAAPVIERKKSCDDFTIALDGVTFAKRSVELGDSSRQVLDAVIVQMKAVPDDIRFEVRAHTDDVGTELYNYSLSLARARTVRDYMAHHGIPLERIDAQGYGEWRPLQANDTVQGRDANRRAELVLLGVDKYIEDTDTCPELATPMPSVPR